MGGGIVGRDSTDASQRAVIMNSNPDFTRNVVVGLENGLHLGPSSQIVQLAQKFSCELRIRKGDRVVDAKSMLELMQLAAEHGAELQLEAHGSDGGDALEAIARLFERNFEAERPVS